MVAVVESIWLVIRGRMSRPFRSNDIRCSIAPGSGSSHFRTRSGGYDGISACRPLMTLSPAGTGTPHEARQSRRLVDLDGIGVERRHEFRLASGLSSLILSFEVPFQLLISYREVFREHAGLADDRDEVC